MLFSSVLVAALTAVSVTAAPPQKYFAPAVPSGFTAISKYGMRMVDSEQNGYPDLGYDRDFPSNVLDQYDTLYCTPWLQRAAGAATIGNENDPSTFGAPMPHHFNIYRPTDNRLKVSGLLYTPRQDGSPRGHIGDYEISYSYDFIDWKTVRSGTWADNANTKFVEFCDKAQNAPFWRLTARREAGDRGQWACATDITLVSGGPSRKR